MKTSRHPIVMPLKARPQTDITNEVGQSAEQLAREPDPDLRYLTNPESAGAVLSQATRESPRFASGAPALQTEFRERCDPRPVRPAGTRECPFQPILEGLREAAHLTGAPDQSIRTDKPFSSQPIR